MAQYFHNQHTHATKHISRGQPTFYQSRTHLEPFKEANIRVTSDGMGAKIYTHIWVQLSQLRETCFSPVCVCVGGGGGVGGEGDIDERATYSLLE